jgi:hypothetical protein
MMRRAIPCFKTGDSKPPFVLGVVSLDIVGSSSVLQHPLSKLNTRPEVSMHDRRSSSSANILLGSMSSGTSTVADHECVRTGPTGRKPNHHDKYAQQQQQQHSNVKKSSTSSSQQHQHHHHQHNVINRGSVSVADLRPYTTTE